MSRRDYPVADVYEEREREIYRNPRRTTTREYRDFEDDVRTNTTPEFLREGYGRSSNAGQLVVRGGPPRDDFDDTRSHAKSARGSPPRRREVEREEIIIRDDRGPAPRRREVEREDFGRKSMPDLNARRPRERESEEIEIDIRRREDDTRSVRSSRRPREVEKTDIDIDIRHSDDTRSVRSSRPREYERDDVTIRRAETERIPPPSRGHIDSEEIIIRRGERESFRPPPPRPIPPPVNERTEIDIDIDRNTRDRRGRVEHDDLDIDISHSHSHGRGRDASRDRVVIREQSRGPPRARERSMPPPSLMRRDTEEFVIRRRRPSPSPSPSPPPPPPQREGRTSHQEIIIRRTERSPTPPPPPPMREPTPEPPPVVLQPIIRPPIHQEIHQEIITHHRHIDHGVERARSPSPLPLPPPPPPAPEPIIKNETLEIDIRRESSRGRHLVHDDEIDIDIRHSHGRERSPSIVSRARSVDASISRRHHHYDDEFETEAQYYNRKALERGYPGEGLNGATRDWALVDVPPGTEKVRMDGAGGGAQEITWQRYNGNRKSKFMSGGREVDTGYGDPSYSDDKRVGPPSKSRDNRDMWTEVTKDLVLKEAVEALNYEYEETDEFFYVMEYLKYEDVLRLVEVSDDIRKQRRRRIRELEWERSTVDRRPRDEGSYYEREIVIDKRERRY